MLRCTSVDQAIMTPLHALVQLCILSSSAAAAFSPQQGPPAPGLLVARGSSRASIANEAAAAGIPQAGLLNDKDIFLNSLDDLSTLNQASKERTSLLNTLIGNKHTMDGGSSGKEKSGQQQSSASIDKPGSEFAPVAPGTWRVIYAPHMTTMANLAGGSFQVEYVLTKDGAMDSHARYDFPVVGKGYLSVSGTYGSVDDTTCRVDFDEAWVRNIENNGEQDALVEDKPYATIDDVPDSLVKKIIRRLGRLFFFDGVSVFPVSFLDDNLIVFDFELLGTRICARKIT